MSGHVFICYARRGDRGFLSARHGPRVAALRGVIAVRQADARRRPQKPRPRSGSPVPSRPCRAFSQRAVRLFDALAAADAARSAGSGAICRGRLGHVPGTSQRATGGQFPMATILIIPGLHMTVSEARDTAIERVGVTLRTECAAQEAGCRHPPSTYRAATEAQPNQIPFTSTEVVYEPRFTAAG